MPLKNTPILCSPFTLSSGVVSQAPKTIQS